MRLGPGNSIVTDLIPFFWAADRDSLAPLGRADLKPEIKTALSRIEMLSKETPSFGTRSMDDFDLAVYMADGKASRSIIWAAYAMTIKNVGSEPDAVKTQFGPLPGVPVLGAWLLAAPSNRDNQELARQFIAFATGKEELVRAAAAGNPPPRKSVLDEDFRKLYSEPFANALEQSLDHARPRPRWRDWKQVELQIGACLSDLSASLIQPEDALIRINSRIKPADQPISGAVASCHEDRSDSGESHTRQTPH
jgi:multiple sugar transport system substrate-binding protein